jgi:UDP-sulfoquinovose synthase
MKFFFLLATVTSTATAFTTGFAPSVVTKSSTFSFTLNAEAAAATTNGTDKKKVIILGGDGFCGWPTSLYLSDQGHDVVIVDNLSRRNIDTELGCDSLTPIQSPAVSSILVAVLLIFL